ncbi:hypothetical protein ACT4ML_04015 [Natrinema sp. LN54]|uniref:hypothetical protein n=1 Tax=Natrinema sp. LN54 TaxID=3458705 RepID=UPI00403599B6
MSLDRIPESMKNYLVGNALLILAGSVIFVIHVLNPNNQLWSSLGSISSAVLASGLVGFVYYFYMRKEKRYEEAVRIVDEWGLLDIQEGRADKERYRNYLLDCTGCLHIQAISLRRFQTDLGNELEELGRQGVEIKLLLLDPDSEVCDWYGEADSDYANLEEQIRDSSEEFIGRDIDNLEVRYYRGLPVNYFRVDDKVFTGPYFAKQPSRNTTTFLSNVNKSLAEGYKRNFEEHWEKYSREIDE